MVKRDENMFGATRSNNKFELRSLGQQTADLRMSKQAHKPASKQANNVCKGKGH
jgi:hypothetical protein